MKRVFGARWRLPEGKPMFVYDGECGFCRRWVERWAALTGDQVCYLPYQQLAHSFPELSRRRFREAAQLIQPDGRVYAGAEAVFRALALAGHYRWLLGAHLRVPGFARVARLIYAVVARHRRSFGRLDRLLFGRGPASTLLSRCAFVRGVALVYLSAFLSVRPQLLGLVGQGGIMPVREHLELLRSNLGRRAYLTAPTLCWLNSSDRMLRGLCDAGVALSLMAVCGLAPAPSMILLWLAYLSLVVAGQEFLRFQWDALLLETGLLAAIASPLELVARPSRSAIPPAPTLWAARWLLFRLLLSSGAVKLTSGDPAWRKRQAVRHHYETQPLPTWTAWYAHQLPRWFHELSVLVVFAIELGAPLLLLLGPRRSRRWAAAATVLLQALIALSGNFGFFNLLTAALLFPALDDSVFPRARTNRLLAARRRGTTARFRWPPWLTMPVAVVMFAVSLPPLLAALGRRRVRSLAAGPGWPRRQYLARLRSALSPFSLGHGYGLFAVMTTRRPEIVFEGSRDGETWLPYEMKWKPGDVTRRPRFTGLHMPRLDWQLWFAALGDILESPWVIAFMARLLEGAPDVLALLANDPFQGVPPRFVRAVLYEYRFTDRRTRAHTGAWWTRERLGLFAPVLTLPAEGSSSPT